VAILGFGTVGGGVVSILQRNAAAIAQKVELPVVIYGVADPDLNRPRPAELDKSLLTADSMKLVNDPQVDILVEAIGGIHPALDYILAAIEQGKSVVTSNKELMAKHGSEILEAAERKKVDVCFEASVAGGIPILHALKEPLSGNQINEVVGILNGTTNYILTKMTLEGKEFAEALKEAQELGYAEKDPSDDIEGHDAAYKLCILASVAYASRIGFVDVYREGISAVTKADIAYADELGFVVKLLAIARDTGGNRLELRVHPAFLPKRHPLAGVNDVFNAIFLRGDAMNDIMFFGRGAGALPTGSAVVGDIIYEARNIRDDNRGRVLCTCYNVAQPVPMPEVRTRYYIRIEVEDQPGVLGRIATTFGENGVSVASLVQKQLTDGGAEIVWLTHEVEERSMFSALTQIRALPVVHGISSLIRVEGSS
jgi:homoserine dehydrogenase